jgi:hypothetical protein
MEPDGLVVAVCGERLVRAGHERICTRLERVAGQVGVEAVVGAPGLVHHEGNPMCMDDFRMSADVRQRSGIGRLHQEYRPGSRVIGECAFDPIDGHVGRQAGDRVDLGAYPHRRRPRQCQAEEQRAV